MTEPHRVYPGYRDADGYDLEQDSRQEDADPSGFYPDERLEHLPRYAPSYLRARAKASPRSPDRSSRAHP